MKISLIDFDSTGFPNLALMKISALRKSIGDEVKFYEPLFDNPDFVYGSKVFRNSKSKFCETDCDFLGGTGSGYDISLGEEFEHICPDYELYPNTDCSMGFITRGCIRKCSFCIVPKKEGNIYFNAPIEEFQRHKKVVLLDNNILACEKGIDELKKIAKTDTRINVAQGLDFRLVDNSAAELISGLKWIKGVVRTACDDDANFNAVQKAVELLGKKGVSPYRIVCYVLVKGIEDVFRIHELDMLGVKPFAMGYMDYETGCKSQEVIDICRWCNRKQIFNAQKDFFQYRRNYKETLK